MGTVSVALLVVALIILAVTVLLLWRASLEPVPSENNPDTFPVRMGIILLGLIALACIIGLFFVNESPPSLSASPGDGNPGGRTELAGDQQGGETTPEADAEASSTSTPTATSTANLGLAGQIVGILGTVAAAAVGGIAGLLVPSRRG